MSNNCYKKGGIKNNDEINKDNDKNDKDKNKKPIFIKNKFDEFFEKFYKSVNKDDIEREYIPIKSAFKWENNNCWLISVVHSLLNIPVYQYFIKNTEFDKNDEFQKRYIILQKCLKTLLDNNNCVYNLDFSEYYDSFYEDMVKFKYVEKEKIYGFNYNFKSLHYFIVENSKFFTTVNESFRPNYFCKKYNKNQFLNNKEKILDEYCNFVQNTCIIGVLLKKLFGNKIDNYLNNIKNNYSIKWHDDSGIYFPIKELLSKCTVAFNFRFFSNDEETITTFNEKIKKGYKIYNYSKDEDQVFNYFKFLDDYDYKINSIIYGAEFYHLFSISSDIDSKYYNQDTYKENHCGKIDNFPYNLNDNLNYKFFDDSHNYFINDIFITISKK